MESRDLEALTALKKLTSAVDSIAQACPALIKLLIALAYQLQSYAKNKNLDLKKVNLGTPKWTNDGYLVIKIEHKGKPLGPHKVHL